MKVLNDGGEIKLIPETETEKKQLDILFSKDDEKFKNKEEHETCGGDFWGKDVTIKPDGSFNLSLKEAWWNHDD